MKKHKAHIAIILLILFSVLQFAALHSLTHKDSHTDDCEQCAYIHSGVTQYFLKLSEVAENTQILQQENKKTWFSHACIFKIKQHNHILYGRPPPNFIV